MKKPKTQFRDLDAAQLIQFAEEIAKKIDENDSVFATPAPGLGTLLTAITVFRDSVTAAAFNDRLAIASRNQRRAELEYVIYELGKYVDTVARGDETVILSAGFHPSKTRVFGQERNPRASQLEVEPGGLGTMAVKARIAPWTKARYYRFEFRQKGAEERWDSILSTKSALEIGNLEAFREYEFRATYLGKDTVPNYSDIISTYAL